jgi:hypothetical protein
VASHEAAHEPPPKNPPSVRAGRENHIAKVTHMRRVASPAVGATERLGFKAAIKSPDLSQGEPRPHRGFFLTGPGLWTPGPACYAEGNCHLPRPAAVTLPLL